MTSKKTAAIALLPGLDLAADFHTLNSATVERLREVADAVGYHAPANANGSTARCFFEYLARGYKPMKTAQPLKSAHVHRFGDKAAVSLPGKGETVYLTPKEARALARALQACARDIGAARFTASNFATVTVGISAPGCRD